MKKQSNKRVKNDTGADANNEKQWLERLKKIKLRNEALMKIINYFNPNDPTRSNQSNNP
jgi:hypothetical protein